MTEQKPKLKTFRRPRKAQPAPSGAELTSLISAYFDRGGVIKVCPLRHAYGAFRGTLLTGKKAK